MENSFQATGYSQSNEPRLQIMFQKYPLLALDLVNVINEDIDLYFLAVWYGIEVVQKGPDCTR
jgi:hypothetical protein